MKLSLGPVLFFWSAERLGEFYQQVSDSPVDIVYLGETVCSKRRSFAFEQWFDTAKMLAQSGKQVVLSTLALLEAESELKTLRRYCDNGEFTIEANDMAAVQLLSAKGLPFITGPTINIYNAQTLKVLYKQGLQRWVMPVELSAQTLTSILSDLKQMGLSSQIETEVFSYGYMPLALSARCFTARAHNIPKDQCNLICLEYPSGMSVETQEKSRQNNSLFTLNGIQTLSGQIYDLYSEIDSMKDMGVDIVRLSPQPEGMQKLIESFANKINNTAQELIPGHDLQENCNGYWYDKPGMDQTSKLSDLT